VEDKLEAAMGKRWMVIMPEPLLLQIRRRVLMKSRLKQQLKHHSRNCCTGNFS
jgi:hypothetical protein